MTLNYEKHMKKRIFVAVGVSENLRKEILKWREKRRAAFSGAPVRWLAGKNLHITLVPPWREDDVPKAAEALGKLKGTGPFFMEFQRIVYGPTERSPRLIWAEGPASPQIIRLKKAVEDAFGAKGEKRPFRLHLTVARFRPEDFSSFAVQKLDERADWKERAESVLLMESRLSPAGADYEILAEVKL